MTAHENIIKKLKYQISLNPIKIINSIKINKTEFGISMIKDIPIKKESGEDSCI
jgi:hypothetical protein